jgi:hypothetical protein
MKIENLLEEKKVSVNQLERIVEKLLPILEKDYEALSKHYDESDFFMTRAGHDATLYKKLEDTKYHRLYQKINAIQIDFDAVVDDLYMIIEELKDI